MDDISRTLEKQKAYFAQGATLGMAFRMEKLSMLRREIKEREAEILKALQRDLNKAPFEGYETEVGLVLEEISYMQKNLARLMKPKTVKTPITHFPSRSRIYSEPYGSVLIMAPWNYPFQLAMIPLVGAIATGNCAFVKPSNYAPNTSAVILKLISETFRPEYIAVVEGGRDVNQSLLSNPFDYIFFTGSVAVGKIVMEKAAKHLTPVTLELGGKSPCIVDRTANIPVAAKRIVWGKLLNSGQTCVAPDYILVHESVKEQLIKDMKRSIKLLYGAEPHKNCSYPKIINQKHYERLTGLIDRGTVLYGGERNPETLQIAPALMEADWNSEIMQDEIFGPILPILTFRSLKETAVQISRRPKPLSLYLFTTSPQVRNYIVHHVSYGGGCVNDTIVHLATSHMPFGGVGNSGMGGYHGENSFRTLSHQKSVLEKANWLDLPVRYAPYKKWAEKVLRMLLK